MPDMISTSQCAAAEAAICDGCKHEDAFLIDGVGCFIQLRAEFTGIFPDEWTSGKCSKWEAQNEQ